MKLGELRAPRGATHRPKRRGFGESSGHGKTSGRGTKGQRSRSGPGLRPEFEGGQMPLVRRIPKRGFHHLRSIQIDIVNVETLNRFPAGSTVDPSVLAEAGLVRSRGVLVKILGEGELKHPLQVSAHRFSKSAAEKITQAGGTASPLKG
ncbi:MAG: 50S ribosomal protein L15 [Candidatus Omnitrophica bacterium]|nr:50S ribosomal protein L15 [Candidatus Omnitrophota bacterium]